MSAIAGIIDRHHAVDKIFMDRMATRIRQTSETQQTLFQDSVALTACGRQPQIFPSHDKKYLLAVDGELFNPQDLIADLEQHGCSMQYDLTQSPWPVLFQCYKFWGQDFIQHLTGSFAFILYDSEQKKIWLGRDRLGTKPLYFSLLDQNIIAFASHLKALLAVCENHPQINPQVLAEFFQLQSNNDRNSIFQGIFKVMPAEMVCINQYLGIFKHKYWHACDIQPANDDSIVAFQTFDTLIDRLILEQSTLKGTAGLVLSTPVESSILLGKITKYQNATLNTYSMQADADRWVKSYNTNHTPITARENDIQLLGNLIWCTDELNWSDHTFDFYYTIETASHNIDFLYHDLGSREAFASQHLGVQAWIRDLQSPGTSGYRTRGQIPSRLWSKLFNPPLLELQTAFRQAIIEKWQQCENFNDLQRIQWTEFHLLVSNRAQLLNRISNIFGIPLRLPFADHRIIEFGLSLPDRLKPNANHEKSFLQRCANRFIDPAIRNQPNPQNTCPFWIDWIDQYRQDIEKKLMKHPLIEHWFNRHGMQNLVKSVKTQTQKQQLWTILYFAIWYRLIMDNQKPPRKVNPLDLLEIK